jgi:hypothetical protein
MILSFRFLAGIVLALLLTTASGLLHGRISQRWGFDQRMHDAGTRLTEFPEQLGNWQYEDDFELSKSAIELLDCQGYIHRGYRHRETGEYVKLAVMVGPGSKMSIHVPEICYEASNFTLIESRRVWQVEANDQQHAFWGVVFKVNDVSQRQLRVLYGWSNGQTWVAPESPRWAVAGEPVLYKLQLAYALQHAGQTEISEQRLESLLLEIVNALEPYLVE